jgi:hypothetical protein
VASKKLGDLMVADTPPCDAPELNPDEGVWSLAKRQPADDRPYDVDELMKDIIRTMERVRRSRTKLRGCVLRSELPLFLR